MNEMVHLRLDPKMRAEIRTFLGDDFYGSETEFIKDSIRRNLELYRKIKVIHSLRGSCKRVKNPKSIPRSEVFRALGLED